MGYRPRFLYVAVSIDHPNRVKVGISDHPRQHGEELCLGSYAGSDRWRIAFAQRIWNAEKAERMAHGVLKRRHGRAEGLVGGNGRRSREVFEAPFQHAVALVRKFGRDFGSR
ncbi:GIY-YIG nuclease family protein [Azospirillum thiophilum]|uniref:GIY-YIG nuclease family protein n=1 Tax=Azospirillum thiophilum TaxID=528244 RepID=UPI0011875368